MFTPAPVPQRNATQDNARRRAVPHGDIRRTPLRVVLCTINVC